MIKPSDPGIENKAIKAQTLPAEIRCRKCGHWVEVPLRFPMPTVCDDCVRGRVSVKAE